jgi:hypothetical protein
MHSDVLLMVWLGLFLGVVSVCYLFDVLLFLGIAEICFCVVLLLGRLWFCSYLSIAPLVLLLSRGFVPKQVSCF